jgi:hypothetical protein
LYFICISDKIIMERGDFVSKDRIMEIVDVQDGALADEEYLQLHREYSIAQKKFCRLMGEMSPWEKGIVENYLLSAAALHQRLMELAIDYGRSSGR